MSFFRPALPRHIYDHIELIGDNHPHRRENSPFA